MNAPSPAQVVQKLWRYCNILRDDGLSYNEYVEQLTYLLFLKMADERIRDASRPILNIPAGSDWRSLKCYEGETLEEHYARVLKTLAEQRGLLGMIFGEARNKIKSDNRLHRLVELIDSFHWTDASTDVMGETYEGLLQKNAEDTKSGAGQYFTPRAVIRAIVDVMRPEPWMRICDPACGTGGFLLAAHDYMLHHHEMSREERQFLKNRAFQGWEIVKTTARLCVMNLFLHGIGDGDAEELPIHVVDSLLSKPSERFDMVLTNPPFGRKSSLSLGSSNGERNGNGSDGREAGSINRDDFWATTRNKQLNFLQHVYSLLKVGGRAAIVVPDNVLFEGGAGETIRRTLLQKCDMHTLLRLPTGIFYAPGVKANVLFFEKCQSRPEPHTKQLWVYDLRTNMNCTRQANPLRLAHLHDFVTCYCPGNRHQRKARERFHPFSYEELCKRDKLSLDLFWLHDETLESPDQLPPLEDLTRSIITDLESALHQFQEMAKDLGIEEYS
jgi:type I restriction enzyme M protein